MNYGELRIKLLELLNRDDCTNAQADTFISMGLRRVERLLRTPIQKTTAEITVDGAWTGSYQLPSDFLGVYTVAVNDIPISRITRSQTDRLNGFRIEGARVYFYPDLQEGDEIEFVYYNEFLRGVADDTLTDYSVVLTDIAIYAALTFAGDHFEDARLDRWEGRLGSLVQETQMMADIDEMSGGGMMITPYGGGIT